jgi:hypothetical protein
MHILSHHISYYKLWCIIAFGLILPKLFAQDTSIRWVQQPFLTELKYTHCNLNCFRINKLNKQGLCNKFGQFIVPVIFDSIIHIYQAKYTEELFITCTQKGKTGLYSVKKKSLLLPCKYTKILPSVKANEHDEPSYIYETVFTLIDGFKVLNYDYSTGKISAANQDNVNATNEPPSYEQEYDDLPASEVFAEPVFYLTAVYIKNKNVIDSFIKQNNVNVVDINDYIPCFGPCQTRYCGHNHRNSNYHIFTLKKQLNQKPHEFENAYYTAVFNDKIHQFITRPGRFTTLLWYNFIVRKAGDSAYFFDSVGNHVYKNPVIIPQYAISCKYFIFRNLHGKYGLFNTALIPVLKPQYNCISYGHIASVNSVLLLIKNKKFYDIYNPLKNKVYTVHADSIYGIEFNNAVAIKRGKYYWYNLNTEKLLPYAYDSISLLSIKSPFAYAWKDGLCCLFDRTTLQAKTGYFKSISNKLDMFLHTPNYLKTSYNYSAEDSIFIVINKDNNTGILDWNGNEILPCIYEKIISFFPSVQTYFNVGEIKYFVCYKNGLGSCYSYVLKAVVFDSIIQTDTSLSRLNPAWLVAKNANGWQLIDVVSAKILFANADSVTEIYEGDFVLHKNGKHFCFSPKTNIDIVKPQLRYYNKMDKFYDYIVYLNNDSAFIQQHASGLTFAALRCNDIWISSRSSLWNYGFFYRVGNKTGLLNIHWGPLYSEARLDKPLFDDLICGDNNVLWAKYNGKWGILKTDPSPNE